jgi:hypothetical protein
MFNIIILLNGSNSKKELENMPRGKRLLIIPGQFIFL